MICIANKCGQRSERCHRPACGYGLIERDGGASVDFARARSFSPLACWRLFRYLRKSGMTVRASLSRAWAGATEIISEEAQDQPITSPDEAMSWPELAVGLVVVTGLIAAMGLVFWPIVRLAAFN